MERDDNLRILVVDDDSPFADSLARFFKKRLGARVEISNSAGEARERTWADYEVIVLDYQMPGCDGLSLLEEILAVPGSPAIIMLTGHGDERLAADAFRLGVADYVVKDQRMPDLLLNAVRKALDGRALAETRRKLADSEREYKELVETASSIILKLDTNGTITYMNVFGLNFFGYNADELLGRNALGTIVEDVDATGRDLAGMVGEILANPDGFSVHENENIKKSGERVWISWTNKALFDCDGRRTGHLAIGNDVTALRLQSELLDRVSDAIVVQEAGARPETRILYLNRAAEELVGYTSGEAIGRPSMEILKPEYEGFAREQKRRELLENKGGRFLATFTARDGRKIPVEIDTRIDYGDSARPMRFVSVVRDISERLSAQKDLERQAEILRNIVEAIITMDNETRVTSWNVGAERLYGFREGEALGRSLAELLGIDFRAGDSTPERIRLIDESEIHEFESFNRRKDGTEVVVEVSAWRTRDEDGQPNGFMSIHRDVTERRKAETALARSEEEWWNLDSMASSVIIKTDKSGAVNSVNRYCLDFFGFSEEDVVGRSVFETMMPKVSSDGRDYVEMMRSIMENPDLHNPNVNENVKKNGERVWLSWANRALRDEEGNVIGALAIGNEVTQLVKDGEAGGSASEPEDSQGRQEIGP